MAIYYLSATPISRSQGKSSVASAAYRAGEKLHDERLERTFDYSHKSDVVFKEILLPSNAPLWMSDREKLWNAVEKGENRKDAQLARELCFSLPRELSKEQNIELSKEFVKSEFVSRGMIADLSIHAGKTKDGEEQPHAHVMLTMREVTENGFGLKERSWNAKENLMLWRESWADYANKYLALNDIDQKIDHRSLADRGIDLIPQKKIGPKNLRVHEQRLDEHQQIARENGEKILADPFIVLNALTYHQSTFTHRDLAKFINKYTVDAEQFQVVYEKVKLFDGIVALGKDETGNERFTTKEMVELEKQMLNNVSALRNNGHVVAVERDVKDQNRGAMSNSAVGTNAVLGDLSSQQKEALEHITNSGDIKCVIGYAGTGKSHMLNEARKTWEAEGYKVHGATLAGIAAESLEGASGIESRTLASRFYYWDTGRNLTKNDILVIDEAGVLGTRQMAKVINEVITCGAKLVLVGDPQQLQAIEAGAAFRAICGILGYAELTEVRRQLEIWQQNATKSFARGDVQNAISQYDRYGHVHKFETQVFAKMGMVDMWNDVRIAQPNKALIMIAYTCKDVDDLNEMARDLRKQNNELGKDCMLQTINGSKPFAEGDRIYFLRNNRDLGVMNGTLGTIGRIADNKLTVLSDKKDADGNRLIVNFDIKNYNYISHGYAATVYKTQAITVDRSFILFSEHYDKYSTYPAMTRHKESVDVCWSEEKFSNYKDLLYCLSRDRSKDMVLDYLGFEVDSQELNSDTSLILGVQDRSSLFINEYQKLNQSYIEAKAKTDRASEMSNAEFIKQCLIEDKAQVSLEKSLDTVCKDIEVLRHLDQHDNKLFSGINEKFDDKFAKAFEEYEAKEKLTKAYCEFENNEFSALSAEEKFSKFSEKYNELKQAYIDAREKTDYVGKSSSYDEFIKQCSIEDEAKENFELFVNKAGKDKDYMDHLSKHDDKTFQEMNEWFNEIEREHLQELQKDREILL